MNLQQLEYIIAVDKHGQFGKAAENCFVTQPTLSMMIQKLEAELSVQIFDRTKQPIKATKAGEEIIAKAKDVLRAVDSLKESVNEMAGEISGELHLGIIPTLAPYLVPLFVRSFSSKYPKIKLYIKELVTDEIVDYLKSGKLDVGLLAVPLRESQLQEHHLFLETFYIYASKQEKFPKKKYLLADDINLSHLWLLEEGHCLRNQVMNLCELKKQDNEREVVHYEAGSMETLINLVDKHEGITIITELAKSNLNRNQLTKIREFASPKPVRQIGLVTKKSYSRDKIIKALIHEIKHNLPKEVQVDYVKNISVTPVRN